MVKEMKNKENLFTAFLVGAILVFCIAVSISADSIYYPVYKDCTEFKMIEDSCHCAYDIRNNGDVDPNTDELWYTGLIPVSNKHCE